MNGYFKEINKNKYLILVPTDESKEIMKKYEELYSKIRDLKTQMIMMKNIQKSNYSGDCITYK